MLHYKAVIFDLDGTLSDPQVGITTSIQYALSTFGVEEKRENLLKYIGPPLRDCFADYLDQSKVEQAITAYRSRYAVNGLFENDMYAGVPQMLENVKALGVKIGLATSKPQPYAQDILDYFGIAQYFDGISGATLDGTIGEKTQVIEICLEKLGVKPQQAIMVGDRHFDLNSAKELGMGAIGCSYGFADAGELEACNHLFIANNPAQIFEYLCTISGGENA